MMNVYHAVLRRVLERGGHRYAEVEVHTDHPRDPQLLAYFRKEGNGKLQLIKVMSGDADHETDGFDNHSHSAYVDVTAQMFNGPSHAAGEDRSAFGKQVLQTGDIRQELERSLS